MCRGRVEEVSLTINVDTEREYGQKKMNRNGEKWMKEEESEGQEGDEQKDLPKEEEEKIQNTTPSEEER